jgi:6-pyruvoyltetrahydropterin/6-carboxytetrahydropterin synthase
MISITKTWRFEAAHRLHNPAFSFAKNEEVFGKCSRMHGHSYSIEVTVQAFLNDEGMVMNFDVLSEIVKRQVVEPWDHRYLNELIPFDNTEAYPQSLTTAENMVRVAWGLLQDEIRLKGADLREVTIWETSTSRATARL